MTGHAAFIGAGVVGAGWAARFALHGWDVAVYDPAPASRETTLATLTRARGCLRDLYDQPLPTEGRIRFESNLIDAVSGAGWVQESVPEQLEAKRELFAKIAADVDTSVPIASSTSGFKPSELARDLDRADQVLVCHPFQPVYLLPAVEVVPGQWTRSEITEKAQSTLAGIGMRAQVLDVEIDAHIADRLLEAMWREALWLVKDDVATTDQIDAIIRNGFGLRWAQMGLFETYRIAGGNAGMRHFLAQFGPALQWPWSRLTDVPELDRDLIDKIATQVEADATGIDELVAQRDRNLVAVMKALKATNAGAGRVINEFEARADTR